MGIKTINEWEKAVVFLLNLDGWDLEWCAGGNKIYDAIGKTSKGVDCVIEMKFRKTHYEEKMLEKEKYDNLMALDKDIVKIFFVNDTKKRIHKDVYLLTENEASRININISPN